MIRAKTDARGIRSVATPPPFAGGAKDEAPENSKSKGRATAGFSLFGSSRKKRPTSPHLWYVGSQNVVVNASMIGNPVTKSLVSMFPDPEQLLQLDPEELAWVILEILKSYDDDRFRQFANHHTFTVQETRAYNRLQDEVKKVLVEGWVWLQRECLIAPRPGSGADYFVLTRKARQISSKVELEAYRRGNLLAGMLHPLIELESKAAFLRGEYETAIFNAFKEVEVAVRGAGGFSFNDLGVALMNEAFKPTVGPLSEKSLPENEQIGLRNLFAGAIAYYKNPGSHRHFPTDANEVAETLFFASLLLRIVERSAVSKP